MTYKIGSQLTVESLTLNQNGTAPPVVTVSVAGIRLSAYLPKVELDALILKQIEPLIRAKIEILQTAVPNQTPEGRRIKSTQNELIFAPDPEDLEPMIDDPDEDDAP